ncbi:Uncharacterised protein [Bordetella pertussis]|nr:Uncharacterised protein [Bordetella pertussis]
MQYSTPVQIEVDTDVRVIPCTQQHAVAMFRLHHDLPPPCAHFFGVERACLLAEYRVRYAATEVVLATLPQQAPAVISAGPSRTKLPRQADITIHIVASHRNRPGKRSRM